MQKITYNKLVRDRIPEIMAAKGLAFETRVLDGQEFKQALLLKLIEEAGEAQAAETQDDLVGELADLAEVVLAISTAHGITAAEIEQARRDKLEKRGAFAKSLMLVWGEKG
jgi:predicted house-cleaning noncanonical NTP pyrophosphatase (MazG superfamily)